MGKKNGANGSKSDVVFSDIEKFTESVRASMSEADGKNWTATVVSDGDTGGTTVELAPDDPAAAAPAKADRVTTTKTMPLVVELTAEEREAKGKALAELVVKREQVEDEKRAAAATYKARLDALDAEIGITCTVIRSGKDTREVTIEVCTDYKAGTITETRMDTLQVIDTRGLKDWERQQRLDLEDPVTPEQRAAEVESMRQAEADGLVRRFDDNGEPIDADDAPAAEHLY